MKTKQYVDTVEEIKEELDSREFEKDFVNQATIQILKEMGKDRRSKQMNQPKGERWKSDPATQKQKNLLDKFGVNFGSDLSKGKADKLIKYRISNESDQEEWVIE